MKRLVLVVALLASACGGQSPTAPTPAPTPPALSYINLVGAWTGTATIAAINLTTNERATNVCSTTWIVASQNSNILSGTFQLSGGTLVACGQAGTFTGNVTTAGGITLTYTQTAGGTSSCIPISTVSDLSGVATFGTITAQQSVRLSCPTFLAEQTLTLSLTRR